MKRLKKLLILILTFTMLASSMFVYAEDYNGTQGSGDQNTHDYKGAASYTKTGIDIVNISLHFFLKDVRPYAASCND